MRTSETLVLDKKQVGQKINRIAYQIYEDNHTEKEVVIAGIDPNGFILAEKIAAAVEKNSPLKVTRIKVSLAKDNILKQEIKLSIPEKELEGKVIILVDDVLNSGRTLIYGLKPFLNIRIKKLRTVVLVDRNHKRFPIGVDFVGLSLSTTMQELIQVNLKKGQESVCLI